MAFTPDEIQSIVSAVLSSLQTNSRTIDQLTPVTLLSENDCFEINGGKKVTYKVLRDLIASLSSTEQDSLKTLISKCELRSVNISVSESEATLIISSIGKEISCSIPIATTSRAGLITAADKLKLQNAFDNAEKANTNANAALTAANDAKRVIDTKGEPLGLATLNDIGKIPESQLPASISGTKMFDGMPLLIQCQTMASLHSSTDPNCKVVYDKGANMFRLYDATFLPAKYFSLWADMELFGNEVDGGCVPYIDKIYLDRTTNISYRWDGSDMVMVGSDLKLGHTDGTAFPGNDGMEIKQDVTNVKSRINDISILPIAGILTSLGSSAPQNGVWYYQDKNRGYFVLGNSVTDYAETEYNTQALINGEYVTVARQDMLFRLLNDLYRYDGKAIVKVGGAPVGNTLNVTVEHPLEVGEYYSDLTSENQEHDVLKTIYGFGYEALGLTITFAIGEGSWKTYQYIGPNTSQNKFCDPNNWVDLAGMTAGSEQLLNINELCGDRNYNLSLAIKALFDKEASSGIKYRKEGLVITYKRDTESNVWETRQFVGKLDDMTELVSDNDPLWQQFGGGGADISTNDTPEEGGQDAFSTGGAYAMRNGLLAGLRIEPDPDNYIIQGINFDGNDVGDPITLAKGGGGAGQSGSSLTIYCEQSVWGAYGGDLTLKAAIKSVSYDGQDEILGTISTILIIDSTSGVELWKEAVNTRSSINASDLKFTFDFTPYITSAASRSFQIRAIDADGNRSTKNIQVTAVDVTCTATDKLAYSDVNPLTPGGERRSVSMYAFRKNVSKQGIEAVTEMLWEGEWRELGRAIVLDTYTHNVSIDPNNVFGNGEVMVHGAYPVRTRGKDVGSGIYGNTIYSAVMCVDPDDTTPIVAMRFNDTNDMKVQLYDSIEVEIAAYASGETETAAELWINDKIETSVNCTGSVSKVRKQIQNHVDGDTISMFVKAHEAESQSETLTLTVSGSVIDVQMKDGAIFTFDFVGRSNTESDHTISDNGIEMVLDGCNYTSNGFREVLGENVLRIAENVKAKIDFSPFAASSVDSSGATIQMAFSTANVRDENKPLCSCRDNSGRGIGFEIFGTKAVMYIAGGQPSSVTVKFPEKEKQTVAIVVEPQNNAIMDYEGNRYAMVKMYVNGELCGASGYPAANSMRNDAQIKFDSAEGDININYITVYDSSMGRTEAFANYLCRLSDTESMVNEYRKEDVLDVSGKPDLSKMKEKGMPYYVVIAPQKTFDDYDNGVDTGEVFACTLLYFNPQHPEVNFRANNVYWRRQGTTSAQRPVKNDRFNFNKKFKTGELKGQKATVTLTNPDDSTELGRKAILAAKYNKVYVSENGFFVDTVTVKVDYSDSSNANDCSVCDQMNATFRALGAEYMTPVQRAYDGRQILSDEDELEGIQMDHSTKNHPIVAFRATREDATDAWFHAKGNWKEDKGEQVALGFKNAPGYNLGCLNYGDFIEFFGNRDETLEQVESRFKTSSDLDTSMPYLISQYCGRNYAIYRYKNGSWVRSTGSMRQVNGLWVVTGDVLNPVSGYEFLQYDGMCRFLGVESIDDMMKPTTNISSWVKKLGGQFAEDGATAPAWTYYFECMIDDDQLQLDLANGRKVPYDLYTILRWFSTCNQSTNERWQEVWRSETSRYISLKSMMAYVGFTDYKLAIDQWAKNFQPMFFLEDGCSVENGSYNGIGEMEAVRMYFNKVYDCDTCEGKDNDGGFNISAETDPSLAFDPVTNEANPYLGFGSLLYHHIFAEGSIVDENGVTVTLSGVIDYMRTRTITTPDGRTLKPFSPEGDKYFFVEKRLSFWQKQVSSYDGENKYILSAPRSNNRYFYALHGLCLTSIPQFIDSRYSMRDGYYKTSTFFDMPWSGRMATQSDDARLRITAGKRGYYAVGNDSPTSVTESVFLETGESHDFTMFAHNAGALVYIFQASKIRKIDTSELSLDAQGFGSTVSRLGMAEEILIGGSGKLENTSIPGYPLIGMLNLGAMPFLKVLDVSGTTVTGINASECPRLERVDASNTETISFDIARTSPIESLKLPATITELKLLDLKKLTYPGGLQLADGARISNLTVSGCSGIEPAKMLELCPNLDRVHFDEFKVKGLSSILNRLKNRGVRGLDNNGSVISENGRCSGLSGRWICSDFIDANILSEIDAYYPNLKVINCLMTQLTYSDNAMDSENISNPENRTGYKYSTETNVVGYEPTGHIAKLRDSSPVCACTYDPVRGIMKAKPLHNDSLNMYADGTPFDPTDSNGVGYDVMKYIGHFWYKGVNDFANGEKHTFYSINEEPPMSTADNVMSTTVDNLMNDGFGMRDKALLTSQQVVGSEPVVSQSTNNDILKVDVRGMKLFRWPCMNAATIACVFINNNGEIISVFSFGSGVSDMESGDYYITEVPEGAVEAWATLPKNCGSRPVVATDSDDIESIEPTWILHKPELIGAYHGSVDGMNNLRSISGTNTRQGDGGGQVSTWEYDGDGNVINAMAPATLHFTAKDFFNCARVRGKGYQCQDYESWKDFANLVFAILGTRDVQARCGYGSGTGQHVTGAFNNNRPQGFSSSGRNNIWGLQDYLASGYEFVDNCAVNIADYRTFKRNKSLASSGDSANYKWHSWDEETQTERIINGVTAGTGTCIEKVRHGLYCDIVPSKMTAANGWAKYYADAYEFNGSTGRVLARSHNNAYALGGLVYANASYASMYSYSSYGARLAFRGEIELID